MTDFLKLGPFFISRMVDWEKYCLSLENRKRTANKLIPNIDDATVEEQTSPAKKNEHATSCEEVYPDIFYA